LRQAEEPAPASVVPEITRARAGSGSVEGDRVYEPVAQTIEAAPPTRGELAAVITDHYFVEDWKAREWLSLYDWRAALAEAA
jgi:hypothetical protein